jgi:hypothetical protein
MRQSNVAGSSDSFVFRAFSLILLLALAPPALAASTPTRYRFRTFAEDRIRIHFHAEAESSARRVMSLALEILPSLEARYRVSVPSLDIVVHDASDSPNGFALSFPYPLVEVRTASVDGADSGPTESWLRMVVTHELTHIVHLEQGGGIYGFGRKVFGRAPFLFPNALQPTWFIEGLAVREETRGTSIGRGRHTFTRMVVDEAARDGQLAKLDQATLGLDRWPLGNAPYLFGEEFLAFVERKHGATAARDIALSHGRAFRPYLDSRTFKKVTGRSLGALWREFANERRSTLAPPSEVRRLTERGVQQVSPRVSPDGRRVAYTSRGLDRLGEIRLMKMDGTEDRRLTARVSGSALAWSRDGRFIVFDETNQVRAFETRSDLHQVDVATGRRTRLTYGLRASDPDMSSSDGASAPIVFVRRFADRSELALRRSDGEIVTLTKSDAGVEWSHPRFSPSGAHVVVSRMKKGLVDLILVDLKTGQGTEITRDAAVDAEPAWIDEETIVFRSDRESRTFRLFLINRDGSNLREVADSPANAFTPEPSADGTALFFAHYSATGYDLAITPFKPGDLVPAAAPPSDFTSDPLPYDGPARSYSPGRALAPHFYSPFVEKASGEWRVGLATASFDPLLRTVYGVAGSWGTKTGKANGLGYLRYDRFFPTITGFARVASSPSDIGDQDRAEAWLSAEIPIERTVLRSQSLDLTARRRREDIGPSTLDTGVLAAAWTLATARSYPMSISPQDGVRLRVAATRELKAFGSDLDHGKIVLDARGYFRIGPATLASRVGGGWVLGPRQPSAVFIVGGLASPALLDPVGDEPAVLRGFSAPDPRDPSRQGRRLAFGNLELRVPIAHPQRGVRAFPFFLRHVHASVGLDVATVGQDRIRLGDARAGLSIGLGADVFIGHRLPVTLVGGVGFGLNRDRGTVPWLSIGFPF